MLVRKARPLPVECIVRGYLSGSGWKDYQKTGAVCGITLPEGLRESDRLPAPIFTPSTKAELGEHDENITFDEAIELCGGTYAEQAREATIRIYERARDIAWGKGIIIADTKFEFGVLDDGSLIWIDEALSPDSSRFWPRDQYQPGGPQPSFDKQFLRDYLETLDWGKKAPAPPLPPEIVAKTGEKYMEALRRLTGIVL
jgi:phosphoribosylaminoimidazole-succinocarboxamide synthase